MCLKFLIKSIVSVQNRHFARPLNKCYICAHIKNQGTMLSTTDFEEHLSTNMDKITIIKMLLTSQNANRQLQARLDRQNAKLDKQDEDARPREERLNRRIDELTRLNRSGSESQIRLMDQLAELQRQLKQMSGQYGKMLTELKKWKDRNKKLTRKP